MTPEELEEMKNWRVPKVGDKMQTPTGICTVTYATEYRWSGHGPGENNGYGNVPYYEGGNWRIFKVI